MNTITFRYNFDLLASGERLLSFDSVRQAKKHIANNPHMMQDYKHLYLRDNHNSANSRWMKKP